MKILITGATGYLGKKLGEQLVRMGHEIFVVSRKKSSALHQLPFPCKIIEADLSQSKISDEQMSVQDKKSIEAIFHLMGEPVAEGRWSEEKKHRLVQSRVNATENLYLSGFKPKKIISASAIGYYGDRGSEELDETSEVGEGFLSELCKDWENQAKKFAHLSTEVHIVRIGLVLSVAHGYLAEILPFFRRALGGPIGNGSQWMSWIHEQDLIRIFIFCLEQNPATVVCGVAPQPVQNNEMTQKISEVLKIPAILPTPKFVLKLMFGEKESILTASQKIISKNLATASFKFLFPDLKLALEDILQTQSQGEEIFEAKQYFKESPEELFQFFSNAHNLQMITPDSLGFNIQNISTEKMEQGTVIDYKLKIRGVPVRWKTLIEKWNPPYEFTDTQSKGPYQLWHHTHSFEKLGPGTLMTDRVRYKLPLKGLGSFVAGSIVAKDVEKIFEYRRKVIGEIYKLD